VHCTARRLLKFAIALNNAHRVVCFCLNSPGGRRLLPDQPDRAAELLEPAHAGGAGQANVPIEEEVSVQQSTARVGILN
jgi:hypothetical protein